MKRKNLFFYLKWALALFWAHTFFRVERFFYEIFKNQRIKRRIFLSSGNISLINVLTFLKQFPEDNVEDVLVIDTPLGSKEFLKVNYEVAQFHNFKKIICANGVYPLFYFLQHNLFMFDEIYAHNKHHYMRFIQPLFKKSKFVIFDEGIGSIYEQYHPNNKYISKLVTMNYCDKFDRLGWNSCQNIYLNKNIFIEIANAITKKYPFDINIDPSSKTVLFCSAYWQQFNMNKSEYYDYQNNIITKLQEKGYKVIYKKHPRETNNIKIPDGVTITNCLLPLELYNLDILAIVSIASTVSVHPYYYWNIPGFVDINEKTFVYNENKINHLDVNKYMLKTYVPNIAVLLKYNVEDYTHEELKLLLRKEFQNTLNKQGLLSKNKSVIEFFNKYNNLMLKQYGK